MTGNQLWYLPQKGVKSDPANYRPISLTSIVCKIIERFIRDHIMDHFLKNNLFTKQQYGFIKGRSTVLQLLSVLDYWTEKLEKGHVHCVHEKSNPVDNVR